MTEPELQEAFTRLKGVQMTAPRQLKILKLALDKRKGVRYVYTVEVEVQEMVDHERMNKANRGLQVNPVKASTTLPLGEHRGVKGKRVVVVGAGPAGMFAAHALASSGAQVTLLERGEAVQQRLKRVKRLFREGALDPESNICFGEGGAGTFSDGKLTTRKNHPWIRHILDFLVELGAPKEIAIDGKPHIGTDRLRAVVVMLRRRMQDMGVDIAFESKVENLELADGRVKALRCSDGRRIECPDAVVWASGHSARDSFEMLHRMGVDMVPKAFAVGVRIEHPQALVNGWLHGDRRQRELGAADYKVVCNLSEDKSVYSFCMCPGGQVVCSSSHEGYHVVNGMSNYARNSAFANAGLVVKVGEADFESQHPLAGIRFQQGIERRAFEAVGHGYAGPAQNVSDFMEGRLSGELLPSSYEPHLVSVDLHSILPPKICENLKTSLAKFEARYPGFAGPQALLIGTETRTSSPVRLPRNENGQSTNVENFYPCGEGAGYAGGIISAALDGLYVAQCLRHTYD